MFMNHNNMFNHVYMIINNTNMNNINPVQKSIRNTHFHFLAPLRGGFWGGGHAFRPPPCLTPPGFPGKLASS